MLTAIALSIRRSRATRRRIAAITVGCALVAGVYAFMAPKWYSSAVTVVPAKPQGGGASAGLLAGATGGLASGLLDGRLGGADVARIAAVLQSVTVTDAVIEKFDLRKRYGQAYQETARQELWQHCSVKTLPKPSLVELRCEDEDPRFVQQLLAYFAEYGNQVFRRVSGTSASEEVRFLEKRVEELRTQADDAAARMRAFQERHKIVDLDTQAKAVVSSLANLNAQRIAKQLELDFARAYSSGDEATSRGLQSQLSVMGRKARELEETPVASLSASSQRRSAHGNGVFPAALDVPRLRAEYETLRRDLKVAEATLVMALERLEGEQANQARDVSTFLVLDPPTVPTRKSRPKRLVIVAVGIFVGLAAALAYEAWEAGIVAIIARERAAASGERAPLSVTR